MSLHLDAVNRAVNPLRCHAKKTRGRDSSFFALFPAFPYSVSFSLTYHVAVKSKTTSLLPAPFNASSVSSNVRTSDTCRKDRPE